MEAKKPKKLKCPYCRKKPTLKKLFECRCVKQFCLKCLSPEIHNCDFNYKELGRVELKEILPLVVNEKVHNRI